MDSRSLEIRFESVGGLGAHAAAEALASAAVLKLGLNGSAFPSCVPERKGACVRSCVRLAPPGQALRGSGELQAADAIVVFHVGLLRDPATFAGLRKDGTLIYAAPAKSVPDELAALPATARVIRVDAYGIAAKQKCEASGVLLGALCAAFPLLRETGFARDAKECEELSGLGEHEGDLPPVSEPNGEPRLGSSIWNDLSVARSGSLPSFNRERCIHCAMCEIVCPDLCLVWEEGEKGGRFQRELTGVDYRYCKGCLRCVETCPASAMLKKAETPGLAERFAVPLFPDLVE
ncbi:MAG: 4Fe-4S dicluster domain-containing protein [Betaproteobacteria bacterium]|nr:MAG: 4Fe-4S dicluster domain-containing protein [Betaproteobacteria bacterium]